MSSVPSRSSMTDSSSGGAPAATTYGVANSTSSSMYNGGPNNNANNVVNNGVNKNANNYSSSPTTSSGAYSTNAAYESRAGSGLLKDPVGGVGLKSGMPTSNGTTVNPAGSLPPRPPSLPPPYDPGGAFGGALPPPGSYGGGGSQFGAGGGRASYNNNNNMGFQAEQEPINKAAVAFGGIGGSGPATSSSQGGWKASGDVGGGAASSAAGTPGASAGRLVPSPNGLNFSPTASAPLSGHQHHPTSSIGLPPPSNSAAMPPPGGSIPKPPVASPGSSMPLAHSTTLPPPSNSAAMPPPGSFTRKSASPMSSLPLANSAALPPPGAPLPQSSLSIPGTTKPPLANSAAMPPPVVVPRPPQGHQSPAVSSSAPAPTQQPPAPSTRPVQTVQEFIQSEPTLPVRPPKKQTPASPYNIPPPQDPGPPPPPDPKLLSSATPVSGTLELRHANNGAPFSPSPGGQVSDSPDRRETADQDGSPEGYDPYAAGRVKPASPVKERNPNFAPEDRSQQEQRTVAGSGAGATSEASPTKTRVKAGAQPAPQPTSSSSSSGRSGSSPADSYEEDSTSQRSIGMPTVIPDPSRGYPEYVPLDVANFFIEPAVGDSSFGVPLGSVGGGGPGGSPPPPPPGAGVAGVPPPPPPPVNSTGAPPPAPPALSPRTAALLARTNGTAAPPPPAPPMAAGAAPYDPYAAGRTTSVASNRPVVELAGVQSLDVASAASGSRGASSASFSRGLSPSVKPAAGIPGAMGVNPMYQAGAQTRRSVGSSNSKIDPQSIPRPATSITTSSQAVQTVKASSTKTFYTDKYTLPPSVATSARCTFVDKGSASARFMRMTTNQIPFYHQTANW